MGVASWLKQLRRVPGVNKARHLAEVAVTPYVRGDLAELRAVTERDIADLQARLALIEGSQPLVLNAISSTNGVARLSAREMQSTRDDLTGFVEASLAPHVSSIAYLLQRVEMVRAEVLYELRYGQAAGTEASPIAFESKVINPAALEQPDVRLNLGCGHVPLPGFVNVDMRELPGVDVIAVLDDLPVPEGSLAEIFSAHVLEHFPGEELSRRLLPYWRSLLRPGGVFRAVVPDIAAMANGYSSGAIGFETFREVLYGGQEYQGDTHYNGFSAAHLGSLLADAGFEEVAVIAEGRPNGSCLEFEIRASARGLPYPPEMRFSVVVNTLNRAPSLRDTLESLRFQRHDDFEVVVVNGPSTDHTEEMLAQYEGRIKHLRCPVANLSMSRNIGIRAAAGDVVAFIDDDAIPEYDWLAELEHGYLMPPDGIAIEEVGGVGGVVFDYTGTRFQFRFAVSDRHGESAFLDAPPDPAMCVPGGWLYPSLMGTNSSFRREALAAIGLFDETYEYYLDETDVAVRMVDAGYVVLGIDGAPVHHHFLPSHLRNEAKVVTHWYPVVKNRTYFAMRHARSHRPVTDVIRAAIDAGDVRLAESDSAEQAGLIAKGSTDRARVDADRGLLDGIVLGERAGSKCAPAVTLSPPPFVRFPTLPHANRLRIGLVSAGYPPRPMAGIARFISELAPALAALGHDVRVFTRATGHPTVEWEDGVWVHRIGDQHRGLVPGSFDHVDDFATGVVREIERIQPWLPLDCVYGGAWDVETIGVVRATEIPTTIMLATPAREAAEHGGWLADPAIAPGLRALFDLERELFAGAHHVHGISQAVVHTIDQLYREPFTEVPVTVAPIGVRDRHVHELRDAQASPTVLFVGRLEQRKGIDIFLQAVATAAPLHPSAHFQVAGADPAGIAEQWRLDHAGDELADRVEFLGEVDDEQLHHLYASAHIVVLPSRYESFGLVVVEAMMHGAAVLSTDIGGIAEVTRDGIDAVLVPPADAPALAAAMSALLDDPARRAALGDEARRRFLQHFDIARVAPAIVDMLRASIAAHQVG